MKSELSMYDFFKSINFEPPHIQFLKYSFKNEDKIKEAFNHHCGTTEYIFDALNFLLLRYSGVYGHFNLENERPYNGLLWTAFIKNSYSFYTAFELTKKGFYGSARILLRYIYEFLIVSKYVAVSKDVSLYDKWDRGETIWMSSDILKKLEKPDVTEFKNFWKTLCEFTHSSIKSQQYGIEYRDVDKNEVEFNYVITWILLEMSYHLLNRHILTEKIRYYLQEYGDYNQIRLVYNYIHDAFKYTKKGMSKESRMVIKNYKEIWVIKN